VALYDDDDEWDFSAPRGWEQQTGGMCCSAAAGRLCAPPPHLPEVQCFKQNTGEQPELS
jgi:hypothetical protein